MIRTPVGPTTLQVIFVSSWRGGPAGRSPYEQITTTDITAPGRRIYEHRGTPQGMPLFQVGRFVRVSGQVSQDACSYQVN
jgi:hypothetical protein